MSDAKLKEYEKEIAVIKEALTAAAQATADTIAKNPGQWYPCGFAWVKIKPARGRLVSALKELKIGKTDEYEGGYRIPNPSGNFTQWMDAKIDGSRAFVEVLKKHGYSASVGSRID